MLRVLLNGQTGKHVIFSYETKRIRHVRKQAAKQVASCQDSEIEIFTDKDYEKELLKLGAIRTSHAKD